MCVKVTKWKNVRCKKKATRKKKKNEVEDVNVRTRMVEELHDVY